MLLALSCVGLTGCLSVWIFGRQAFYIVMLSKLSLILIEHGDTAVSERASKKGEDEQN